jgi:hypothetical protein
MPQRIMAVLWDFVAQQFRDSIGSASDLDLEYRLASDEYSAGETAWRALGACERWSAVLAGATTSEEALEMSPRSVDLIQAASDRYPPGRFPDTMPNDAEKIIERADDVFATLFAQLSELRPTERSTEYRTWWGATYTGDEIVARVLWTLGYVDGQIRLLVNANRKGI